MSLSVLILSSAVSNPIQPIFVSDIVLFISESTISNSFISFHSFSHHALEHMEYICNSCFNIFCLLILTSVPLEFDFY